MYDHCILQKILAWNRKKILYTKIAIDSIGNDNYRKAYESIKQIIAQRHDAVYHQQAIYEALMLGTEFFKVPDTDALRVALEGQKQKDIDEAVAALKEAGQKFFNKDYNPEVDRKVSKQLIALLYRKP